MTNLQASEFGRVFEVALPKKGGSVTKTILFFMIFVSAYTQKSRAQDTYNFYFQKAPGPTIVNQGSAPVKTPPQSDDKINLDPAAPPATTPGISAATQGTLTQSQPKSETELRKADYLPFYINIGHALWTQKVPWGETRYKGLSAQVGYRFNRHIGIFAEGMWTRPKQASNDLVYDDPYNSPYTQKIYSTDVYSALVTLTPISIHLFGWNFVEIGLMAGATHFSTHKEVEQVDYLGEEQDVLLVTSRKESVNITQPVVGAFAEVALNPNFALGANYRRNFIKQSDRGVAPEHALNLVASVRF